MFFHLKSTLKYVNIRQCARPCCRCYNELEVLWTKEFKEYTPEIPKERYYQYERCYKKGNNVNRDVFLL